MPNVEVRCSVSNCFFHKKGNLCGAEKILIDTDSSRSRSRSSKDAEFASEFNLSKEHAATSYETCCKTFKPKKIERK